MSPTAATCHCMPALLSPNGGQNHAKALPKGRKPYFMRIESRFLQRMFSHSILHTRCALPTPWVTCHKAINVVARCMVTQALLNTITAVMQLWDSVLQSEVIAQ